MLLDGFSMIYYVWRFVHFHFAFYYFIWKTFGILGLLGDIIEDFIYTVNNTMAKWIIPHGPGINNA